MIRMTETVKHLIIINVLLFVGTLAFQETNLLERYFALFYPKNENFQAWQVVTHMFMHGGFMHIFFNMLVLWMFGSTVEQVFGRKKFLFFYFSSGLGAVALTFLVYYVQIIPLMNEIASLGYPQDLVQKIINLDMAEGFYLKGEILANNMSPLLSEYGYDINLLTSDQFKAFFEMNRLTIPIMVGASGALMGILVAFGMLFPNSKLMLIFLPIPIKAKYFIPGLILLDLISAITGQSFFSPSNTAYVAHIGGALTGFLMMYFWKKDQFDKYRWN